MYAPLGPPDMPVHIVVLEADPLTGEGLARGLRDEPSLTAEAVEPPLEEALEYCRRRHPSVLLINEMFLQPADLGRFIAQLDYGRGIPALVLGSTPDPQHGRRWLRLGCMGYASRLDRLDLLAKAIRAVAAGEHWAPRATLTLLVRELADSRYRSQPLTARQREILDLLRAGRANAEISTRLFLSPETVRWHVRRVLNRIGARDRVQAAEMAHLHLIHPWDSVLRPPAPLPVTVAQRAAG